MQEFITIEDCIQVVLDQVINKRKNRVGCKNGEEKCNRCWANKVELGGEEIG